MGIRHSAGSKVFSHCISNLCRSSTSSGPRVVLVSFYHRSRYRISLVCSVGSIYLVNALEHLNISHFESLHTFHINLYLGSLETTTMVLTWITKSIQDLPSIHPLGQIIFDLRGPPSADALQSLSTLDEILSDAGRPVNSVFKLDRVLCAPDIVSRRQAITSTLPRSERLGLVSFAWTSHKLWE